MTPAPFTHEDMRHILVESIGFTHEELPDDIDTPFHELGMDSLAVVALHLTLRTEYGVKIPDEDAHAMSTLREAIDYVNRQRLVTGAI